MSHIVTLKSQMKEVDILRRACTRLSIGEPTHSSHKMYGGTKAKGWGVSLDGWNYPVVVQDNGELKYDNYGGSWGNPARLDELQQAYSTEAVLAEAELNGYTVSEETQEDGTIHLELEV